MCIIYIKRIKVKNEIGGLNGTTSSSSGPVVFPWGPPGHNKGTVLNISSEIKIAWNVRTSYQKEKLVNVKQEMKRMKNNILGVSEMR